MPNKKATEKQTLETYDDLLKFAEGLNKEIMRLGGPAEPYKEARTLRDDKVDILNHILTGLYKIYGAEKGFHYDFNKDKVKGMYPIYMDRTKDSKDALDPPFDQSRFIKDINDRIMSIGNKSYGSPEEAINKILGTHQNWFKWLLSCIFDAPKSKQFMDGYSIFDTKQTKQVDRRLEESLGNNKSTRDLDAPSWLVDDNNDSNWIKRDASDDDEQDDTSSHSLKKDG